MRFLKSPRKISSVNLKNLSFDQAQVLAAVFSVITLEANTEAYIKKIDLFLSSLKKRDLLELKLALFLVEHTPIFFHGFINRFTELSLEDKKTCMKDWQNGAAWRWPVFVALKELCYFAYYSEEKNWEKIGYSGPLVSQSNFVSSALDSRYERFLGGSL